MGDTKSDLRGDHLKNTIGWLEEALKSKDVKMPVFLKQAYFLKVVKDATEKLYKKCKDRILSEAGNKETVFDIDGLTVSIKYSDLFEYGTPTALIKMLYKEKKGHLVDEMLKIQVSKLKESVGMEVLTEYGFVKKIPGKGKPILKFLKK